MNIDRFDFFLTLRDIFTSGIFVLLDEHPDSIHDGWYLPFTIGSSQWVDLPAPYHNGADGVSFADGHSEVHRWLIGNTKRPAVQGGYTIHTIPCGQE